MKKLTLTILAFSSICFADDWQKFPIGPFGGLNTRDSSYAISSQQSPDLLNVELTPAGKSVRKRHGYGIAYALSFTSSPVHGVYDFFDANGNEVNLFFNDTDITSSVGGAAASVIYSTGSSGATYQCTDSLGFAYCANSNRTSLYKTNGQTIGTIQTVNSTGTMVAACVTRLAMAGFAEAPSRIDLSADNDFTSWTIGSLGTSGVQITVNSPGAKITHIVYAFNRLMWFKDTSFGYILIGNQPLQTDWVVKTVSYDVGTNDNSSIYREGILYFRGKDGHIYSFDGYSYQRMSREISGTIAQAQTRSQNSWTQTTQSDFQNGISSPTNALSFTISPGSVVLSSFSVVETSSTDFSGGTLSNVEVTGNSLIISTNNTNMTDNGFESSSWSHPSANFNIAASPVASSNCTLAARTGSKIGQTFQTVSFTITPSIIDGNTGTTLFSGSAISYADNACTWSTHTISANPTYARRYVKLVFRDSIDTSSITSPGFIYSGSSMAYYTASDVSNDVPTPHQKMIIDDITEGASSISTGVYTSRGYDTGLSTNVVAISSAGITINDYTPTFTVQTSSDNLNWSQINNIGGKEYVRYISSFTVTGSSAALTTLNDVTIVARSTGSYYSAVNNASNITSWDSFGADITGEGTQTFYIRAATGSFTVSSSTPAWTSVASGGIPSIATGSYMQIRDDFLINAATQNPSLNSFTINWFEGSASDKMYCTYFDDKLLFALPIGTGTSSNNRILLYDTLNQSWLLWDLPSNGFYIKANKLYFGSSIAGYIYKYGDIENDNGAAINSYWKSKDYFGADPFITQEISNISVVAKEVTNSSMTVTLNTYGTTNALTYIMPLTSSRSFVGLNKNVAAGTNAANFNVQIGNNAVDQSWEVFGIQVGIRPKPWTVGPN